ncbi:MAG: ATP-binding cassette domain-containing protein [Phycisphaera sp.]|nr:ATP-binding cassette domain-containing protein [Phycisphaera sp.]
MSEVEDDVMLRATGLSLGYGRRTIIADVNMEVRRGQRWFIVGPNGQGKSTLLRGVLRLLPAPAAQLWRHPQLMRPDRIGFVPQRCDLNPTLPTTVREFVMLGLVGRRADRAARDRRFAEALRQVDLIDRIDANYWSLSGGQRQRALLARAMVREPAVLLLDEPASGLDLTAEDALMRSLLDLNHTTGLTWLFVSHNVELAARYATHAALVFDGAVHAGPVGDVLRSDLLESAYGVPISVAQESEGVVNVHIGRSGPREGATQ